MIRAQSQCGDGMIQLGEECDCGAGEGTLCTNANDPDGDCSNFCMSSVEFLCPTGFVWFYQAGDPPYTCRKVFPVGNAEANCFFLGGSRFEANGDGDGPEGSAQQAEAGDAAEADAEASDAVAEPEVPEATTSTEEGAATEAAEAEFTFLFDGNHQVPDMAKAP